MKLSDFIRRWSPDRLQRVDLSFRLSGKVPARLLKNTSTLDVPNDLGFESVLEIRQFLHDLVDMQCDHLFEDGVEQ